MFQILVFFSSFIILSTISLDIGISNNRFGFELYDKISEEDKDNVVFSPYSLFSVLGMLVGACDGNSRMQLMLTLAIAQYSEDEETIHQAISDLSVALEDTGLINISHGLFIAEHFEVLQSYIDFALKYYEALVEKKKFPEPGTDEINDWVALETKNMIKDFLETLPGNTVSVLINTIHFKSPWKNPFEERYTVSHQFALIDEDIAIGSYATKMMINGGLKADSGTHEWGTSLKMKFQKEGERDQKFGMMFLLPSENTLESFQNMEEVLTEYTLRTDGIITNIEKDMKYGKVIARIPRFEIDWKLKLNKILKDLGVKDIFIPGTADLSKLADPVGNGDLAVDYVLQQAKIKVEEGGCEASAASAVVIYKSAGLPTEEKSSTFYAHRPFMYLLYHLETNTILFMGKVMEPEKSNEEIEVYINEYMPNLRKLSPNMPLYRASRTFGVAFVISLSVIMIILVCICGVVAIMKGSKEEEEEEKENEKFNENNISEEDDSSEIPIPVPEVEEIPVVDITSEISSKESEDDDEEEEEEEFSSSNYVDNIIIGKEDILDLSNMMKKMD